MLRAIALGLALLTALPAHAADPLPALGADPDGFTASGVSSGGYMAVQLQVAHSDVVAGVGVIAGGPYYCAQGSVFTAYYNCMTPGYWTPLPPTELLKSETDALSLARQIDSVRNLARARAWLFSGTNDHTVQPQVVEALRRFYVAYRSRVVLVADQPAGHGMVTGEHGDACNATREPFIVDCDYDAAGELLGFLLGPLSPPSAKPGGRLLRFDQNRYAEGDARSISMDETGFVYVPQRCRAERCRVHVAFHGCRQGAAEVGERFVREAGYNRWADSNGIVVLYPQVVRRYSPFAFNPRGCWDWWGYTGAGYHTKAGAQVRAVMAMLNRLSE